MKPRNAMNQRSRSHHAAHLDNDRQLGVPEMDLVHRGEPVLLTTDEQLLRLIGTLRDDGSFAYDSEFISELSYHPRLCLVQVASRSTLALIDPLAALDITPFWELLADPSVTKIVHAGDSDIEPVVRHLGRAAANVFDTQIGAGFVGLPYPVSLKKLVFELTGVRLGRDLGFSNWQQRPLSPVQIRYAADDVRYLPAAHRKMLARLEALGHARRAEEECAAACAIGRFGFNPQTHYLRVRGGNVLSPRSQAVLKELTAWRDGAARRHDKPPRALLKDEMMVELARESPGSIAELSTVRSLPKAIVDGFGADIVAAAAKAHSLPNTALPVPEPELSATDKFRADALFAVLQCVCAGSLLDQSLVASRKELEEFHRHVAHGTGETPSLLQGWRREAVGEPLKSFLQGQRGLAMAWVDGTLRVGPATGNA
jgi:ribonuclease D